MRLDSLFGNDYKISDMDSAASPEYYGYLNRFGDWYIVEVTDTTVRYCRGSNSYSYLTAWTNRVSLSYDYFHNVFKLGGQNYT